MDTILGYIFTHWDCPTCGYDNRVEGDVSGEELACEDCETVVRVAEVR